MCNNKLCGPDRLQPHMKTNPQSSPQPFKPKELTEPPKPGTERCPPAAQRKTQREKRVASLSANSRGPRAGQSPEAQETSKCVGRTDSLHNPGKNIMLVLHEISCILKHSSGRNMPSDGFSGILINQIFDEIHAICRCMSQMVGCPINGVHHYCSLDQDDITDTAHINA